MPNLTDTQKSCDKKKYIESLKEGRDMSGAMPWCEYCFEHAQVDYTCDIEHAERVENSVCARAYNRSRRKK